MPTKVISLTKRLQVENGAHILYFYNSRESYVEQAASFVISGIKQQQYIIFVDTPDIYESVMVILQESLSIVDMQLITYINNYDFYEMYHDFNFERVIQNLQEVIGPYIASDATVRLWGHVDWSRGSSNVVEGLARYESHCDISVSELGFLTVCAYDSTIVPAYIQTEMMRTHPYFMTDYELLRSNLYKSVQPGSATIFPSLSRQADIEDEVDFYKKKLDFVHVVSHEVRNPLTIIRAYAKMLHSQETDPTKAQKLSAILDYCTVIDHEIAHIIATEEMLNTDAIWRRSIIFPVPLLQEVLETLGAKARTQNISLQSTIEVEPRFTLLNNTMGYKLVVSNIISNAIKYSYESSQIHCHIRQSEKDFILEVKDSGVGMSQKQLTRLFTKYEKHDDQFAGQGIGLYMVYELVKHFNGTVKIDSILGKGTTVQVRFPIS